MNPPAQSLLPKDMRSSLPGLVFAHTVAAACEVMLNNKLTSSGGDFRTSKLHNSLEHIGENRQCELGTKLFACQPLHISVLICGSVHVRAPQQQQPLAARICLQEQAHRPGDDGGLCWLSSANRLYYRDIGQFGGDRDLQTGGR